MSQEQWKIEVEEVEPENPRTKVEGEPQLRSTEKIKTTYDRPQ
jgi:hypothetical protein